MKKGICIAHWFDKAEEARLIPFSNYTKQDFKDINQVGFDTVRLPIALNAYADDLPSLFFLLDQVIDWCKELDMTLVLDNHTFNPNKDLEMTVVDELLHVWPKVAEYYKDGYDKLIYEIINEPTWKVEKLWGDNQDRVIKAIREKDTKHTILVTPEHGGGVDYLEWLPEYDDNNLLYSFHFYKPFLFTHQGAGHINPSMDDVKNIPYPYDNSMPSMPDIYKDTWIKGVYDDYPNRGNDPYVQGKLDKVLKFKSERNATMFCGEFGVYKATAKSSHRANWHKSVTEFFESQGIAWTVWEWDSGYGMFDSEIKNINHDLNLDMMKAMGLTAPPQTPYTKPVEQSEIVIYDDYLNTRFNDKSYTPTGTLNFHNKESYKGLHAIQWDNVGKWNDIKLEFKKEADLSYLLKEDYWLELQVNSNKIGADFEIKLRDLNGNWSKGIILDALIEGWELYELELKKLENEGFDWTRVKMLRFKALTESLVNTELRIDEIKITNGVSVPIPEPEPIPEPIPDPTPTPEPYENISKIVCESAPGLDTDIFALAVKVRDAFPDLYVTIKRLDIEL